MQPWSRCRISIGSSIVTMCRRRVRLMWSSIAASVVVLPEPVAPVTSTRPRCSSASRPTPLGRRRSTKVLIGMSRPPLERSESLRMRFTFGVLLVFVALGLADRHVDLAGQLGLGFATWAVLLAALWPLPLERRLQTLLVVGVATCMEVVGSILWGVYTYRLHNLPLFVPPGHGLVYLAGISLSETAFVRARPRAFVRAVAVCAT